MATVLETKAQDIANLAGAAMGKAIPPNVLQAIIAALMALVQNCFPVPHAAAEFLHRQGLLMRLLVRGQCRPLAQTGEELDILEATVLDEAAHTTADDVAAIWAKQ